MSLEPQQINKHKRPILIIFSLVGALGFIATIWQARLGNLEKKEQKEVVEKIEKELLQSQLSQEFIKGQLNVTAQLVGKSGDKMASAIQMLAQSNTQTVITTNKQICSNTLDLVKRMQAFEYNERLVERQLSDKWWQEMRDVKTEQERHEIWNKRTAQDLQIRERFSYEFRSTLLGEAVYLKNELLKRLPHQPNPQSGQRPIALEGILAGPSPISDAAVYLEDLSRKLCP